MTVPARYVLPVFLLLVLVGPMILGPLLNLALEPFGLPFHRVISRALLLSALAALLLFRRRLRLKLWWPMEAAAFPQIGLGLALAILSSLLMIGLDFLFCGFQSANLSFAPAAQHLLTALLAALIVPVLEETLFRGFLLTLLVETTGRWIGWLLAAFLYALAHFLRLPSETTPPPVHFYSGATAILSIFTHLGQGDFLSGRGLNLFLVGLILGAIFLRTGTLWINAGLHGGWILILMTFTALTRPPPGLGADLLSSPITSAVLLALLIACTRLPAPNKNPSS
jgi:membrane protease YdiL (CAAX protease family)